MSWQLIAFFGAKILGILFFVLIIAGVLRRAAGRFHPRFYRRRAAQALAASRYARGEITAEAFRQIRDDLKDLG